MSVPDLFIPEAGENETYGRYTQRALYAALMKYLGISGDVTEANIINRELDLSIPTQIVTCLEPLQANDMHGCAEDIFLFELAHPSLNDAVYNCKLDTNEGIFDSGDFRVKIPDTPLIYQGCDGVSYQMRAIFEFNQINASDNVTNRIAIISEVGSDILRVSCVANPFIDVDHIANSNWSRYEPPVYENGVLTHIYEESVLRHVTATSHEIKLFGTYVLMWVVLNRMLNSPATKICITDDNHNMSDKNSVGKGASMDKAILSIQYISNGSGKPHETFTRRTDAWYRRGHYRTLKSGKRIYVKGCMCGPNKDSVVMQERIIEEV